MGYGSSLTHQMRELKMRGLKTKKVMTGSGAMNHYNQAEIKQINEESLQALIQLLTHYLSDNFSLTFARCNYQIIQHRINQTLQEHCPSVEIIDLDPEVHNIYSTITRILGDRKPSGLILSGLDNLMHLEAVLQATKQAREEYRKLKYPVIVWMNDQTSNRLIRSAHDFFTWGDSLSFSASTHELIDLIQTTGDRIYQRILEQGAGIFLDNATLGLETGQNSCQELKTARQELQERGIKLPLELEANLEFILGRGSDHGIEIALNHYQRSRELWQQVGNPIPCALLSYHIGLWWRNYAVLHRPEEQRGCQQAATHFQQSIETFEQANRPDLDAKFINAWAEVLHYLKDWKPLEKVTNYAIELHKTHSNGFRLARVYGFLAEVKLAHSQYREAQNYAQQALELLQTNLEIETEPLHLDWERSYHQGWYLFSFAKAQQGLGRNWEAIATLERAKEQTNPNYDHRLYIEVLETLQKLYFNQKDYLKAFRKKQYHQQIKQQFGLRAFIGASRLRSSQPTTNLALPYSQQRDIITSEITASGRQHDVENLIERICSRRYRLTIIYGQSGVGKSSIEQAGLIPALSQLRIDTRRNLSILQRVYLNWIQELGKNMATVLKNTLNIEIDSKTLNSIPAILEQLQANQKNNLMTILIFDQFEEFFFTCRQSQQKKEFYEFIQHCLEIPFVTIILSLREDYLHYLLECNRLGYLEIINHNILDKDILYHLGNFSPAEAKTVIQNFTAKAQFYLEPELIDQLVQDLSQELGEVRPIELQVVGSQLQTNEIVTLEKYHQLGSNPKEELVQRYLAEVVTDCGSENEKLAWLVLLLLTDENNTRPQKTYLELLQELRTKTEVLDLVLEIFVKSGLVFLLPETPTDRYQLVHDYLVSFIRQRQEAEMLKELEKERRKRKRSEAELNRVLRKQRNIAVAGAIIMPLLSILIGGSLWFNAKKEQLEYLAKTSANMYRTDDKFSALVAAIKAGKQLQSGIGVKNHTKLKVLTTLQQAIHGVKALNILEGHSDEVRDISLSPDGKLIASASTDGTVKLWNIDGRLLNTLPHREWVNSVSFSPDGQVIAATGGNKKDKNITKLWTLDGQELKIIEGQVSWGNSVSFSPNSRIIATAHDDNTIKLWNRDGEELNTLEGHSDSVRSIQFSPDGKIIASAGHDKTIKLWTLDGELLQTIEGHNNLVYSISFSPDGQTITSASQDKTIKLWNLEGELLETFVGHTTSIYSVAFSPDSSTIISGDSDGTIKFWNLKGQELQSIEGHDDTVRSIKFSPDGKMLISASNDKTIKFWNLDTMEFDITPGHSDSIYSVTYSPDGKMIASGSNDKTIKLWNPETGKEIRTLKDHNDLVRNIEFSPDGKLIASGSYDDTIKLWNRETGELILTLEVENATINDISFHPNGQIIAFAGEEGVIQFWNLENGENFQTIKGHDQQIYDISYSPDGKIISSASADDTVKLWDVEYGELIQTFTGHTDDVRSVVFNPDSKIITSASLDDTIRIWNVNTGELIQKLEEHESNIYNVAFSPNGKILASASHDNTIRLWDVNSGQQINSFKGHDAWIYDVNFSPDGKTIISGGEDKMVKLWNLDGTLKKVLPNENFKEHTETVFGVNFSPDGKMIATASGDNTIKLYDSQGEEIQTLKGHSDKVYATRFSPDSQTIASASADNTIKLWDTQGKELQTLTGHKKSVRDIRFSPDGKTIASASYDNTVKLWNIKNGDHRTLTRHNDEVNSISFSSDGQFLASASDDDTMKIWNLSQEKEIQILVGHSDYINSVTFSPDNKIIASGGADKTIKLWDWKNGKNILTLRGHSNDVNHVSFTPDSKMLVSGSWDQTIKFWSLEGDLIQTVTADEGWSVRDISFTQDGQIMASASGSGKVVFWSFDLDKLLVEGCKKAQNYLKTSSNVDESDRTLCDNILSPES